MSDAYRAAGVDIDAKYGAVGAALEAIRKTFTPGVVSDPGSFGGVFDPCAAGVAGQLLVASTDGVGTKVEVATRAGREETAGKDLVNHCVNDALVQGAYPLFFLDYVAVGRMEPERVARIIGGVAEACVENGCALLGGETAEMPGVYLPGAVDVAGTIVGAVPRERLLDGSRIRPGDVAIGLPSTGLHTNGYTLARRLVSDVLELDLDDRPALLGGATVGEALLAPHRSYLAPLRPFLDRNLVHGLVHVTGGGLPDNAPRVLPPDVGLRLRRDAAPRPAIFDLLLSTGRVDEEEAWRVFNMGCGMLVLVGPQDADAVLAGLRERGERPFVMGEAVAGSRGVELA